MQTKQHWLGLILGAAVGDSLGLVAEGISRRRNAKLFHSHWRQRFFLRWGMCRIGIKKDACPPYKLDCCSHAQTPFQTSP
ncbi:MAG: ADP-ribosylglycohydrolase family protein [Methylococcales bacterium]